MLFIGSTLVYWAVRSNPKLPSRASIRVVKIPPTFGDSHFAHGQCQVASSANAQCTIWMGFQRLSQTVSRGAEMVIDTLSLDI